MDEGKLRKSPDVRGEEELLKNAKMLGRTPVAAGEKGGMGVGTNNLCTLISQPLTTVQEGTSQRARRRRGMVRCKRERA